MRIRPPIARSDATSGFVLLEALVSLILATMMIGLFGATLHFGLRLVETERTRDRLLQVGTGLDALSGWLASAAAVKPRNAAGDEPLLFDGEAHRLAFMTLSDGDSQTGGLVTIVVGLSDGGRNGASFIQFGSASSAIGATLSLAGAKQREVLIENVDALQFSYFGSLQDGGTAQWHDTWKNRARLPRLVAMRTRLSIDRRPETLETTFRIMSD